MSFGVGFEVSEAQARPSGFLSLSASFASRYRTLSYHVCLHFAMLPSVRIIIETSETESKPLLNSFIRIALVSVSLHSSRTPNKTEVDTGEQVIAVTDLSILLVGRLDYGVLIRKAVEHVI